VNVPSGVWIDERGRVVRPAEPAWTSTRTDTYGGKALEIEGELYVAALRDWVTNGERSQYALSNDEFARRVKPRSAAQAWSFQPQEAGPKWLEKFLKQPERYYPKLELKPKGG
jgi:hypothetical protein